MNLPTAALEMRLSSALAQLQQHAEDAGGPASTRALGRLGSELHRLLREFDALDREFDGLAAALDAAPADLRWREQARMATLECELDGLHVGAARLASALVSTRWASTGAPGTDLAQAVQRIAIECGRALDSAPLWPALQRATLQPLQPLQAGTEATGAAPRVRVDALFTVFALVVALARPNNLLTP